jgi:hypothetical protein
MPAKWCQHNISRVQRSELVISAPNSPPIFPGLESLCQKEEKYRIYLVKIPINVLNS